MRYLTDRKRASGLGSAKSGVHHHWAVKISSVALLLLVPLFIFTFGPALGGDHAEVMAYYQRGWPALIAALTLAVGWLHFKDGAQAVIEDYVHGTTGRYLIIAISCLSWAAAAAAVLAIIRIAL